MEKKVFKECGSCFFGKETQSTKDKPNVIYCFEDSDRNFHAKQHVCKNYVKK